MFLIKQYITLLSFQIVRYQVGGAPSERVGVGEVHEGVESTNLSEIQRRLADYEQLLSIPRDELHYLLAQAETLVGSLTSSEQEEDRHEIHRILNRITHLRNELSEIRGEVMDIAHNLSEGEQSGTDSAEGGTQDNDHIIRDMTHKLRRGIAYVGSNEVQQDYSSEQVAQLAETRNSRKEIVAKMLISSIGTQYTGGDISIYAEKFNGPPTDVYFARYMKVLSKTGNEALDIHQKGNLYSNDIYELTSIAQEMTINSRDAKLINGQEFGTLRSTRLEANYEELLASTDEKILDIVSPKGEDGERIPKEISKLTNADILVLEDHGYDVRTLFFIGSNGEKFDPKTLETGSTFIINIGENQDASILGLHLLDNRPNSISIDGLQASYQETGQNGPGYYGENGKIELVDGMQVKVLEMSEVGVSTKRTEGQVDERQAVIESAVGRDLYKQALENPGKPIKTKGIIEKFLLAILNALFGKEGEIQPDGTFQIRNQSGGFMPVTGQQFMERYTGSIQSHPIEYTASGVTACGRTAYKNLKMLGAERARNGNAHVLAAEYGSRLSPNLSFPSGLDSVSGPLQLFLDASKKNAAKGYRHTAVAFKDPKGNWQVLDPYYGMNGRGTATRNPIPAGVYMNYMRGTLGKQFHGAFAI